MRNVIYSNNNAARLYETVVVITVTSPIRTSRRSSLVSCLPQQLHVKTTDRVFMKILREMRLWTIKIALNSEIHPHQDQE